MEHGWYPDPTGRFEHRYFNGKDWTGDVATDGRRMVDALGSAASPAGSTPGTAGGGNGLSTAALVTGIVAAALGATIVLFVVAAPLAIVAVVFGLIGLRRSARVGRGRRAAVTGLVLGSAALGLSALGVVIAWDQLVDAYRRARDTIEVGQYALTIDECSISSGTVHIAGSLTNESHAAKAYRIEIEVRPRDVADAVRVETRTARLERGASTAFTADVPVSRTAEDVRCAVSSVRSG